MMIPSIKVILHYRDNPNRDGNLIHKFVKLNKFIHDDGYDMQETVADNMPFKEYQDYMYNHDFDVSFYNDGGGLKITFYENLKSVHSIDCFVDYVLEFEGKQFELKEYKKDGRC